MAGAVSRHARAQKLPRGWQFKSERVPAHLFAERVRGGLNDGVYAGDAGWVWLQVPVADRPWPVGHR